MFFTEFWWFSYLPTVIYGPLALLTNPQLGFTRLPISLLIFTHCSLRTSNGLYAEIIFTRLQFSQRIFYALFFTDLNLYVQLVFPPLQLSLWIFTPFFYEPSSLSTHSYSLSADWVMSDFWFTEINLVIWDSWVIRDNWIAGTVWVNVGWHLRPSSQLKHGITGTDPRLSYDHYFKVAGPSTGLCYLHELGSFCHLSQLGYLRQSCHWNPLDLPRLSAHMPIGCA